MPVNYDCLVPPLREAVRFNELQNTTPTNAPARRKLSPAQKRFQQAVTLEHNRQIGLWSRQGGQGSQPQLRWARDAVVRMWQSAGQDIPAGV